MNTAHEEGALRQRVVLEVLAAFGLGVGLFLLLSLWSFQLADDPGRVFPANAQVANWCGPVGDSAAAFLFGWIGVVPAWMLVTVLLALSLRGFLWGRAPQGILRLRLAAFAGFLLLAATSEHHLVASEVMEWATLDGRLPGGWWGAWLSEQLLGRVQLAGAALLTLTGLLTTGLVAFRLDPAHLWSRAAQPPGGDLLQRLRARPATPTQATPASTPSRPPDGLPSRELLAAAPAPPQQEGRRLQGLGQALEQALESFKVEGEVVSSRRGPNITLLEVKLKPGTKVQKVLSLSDDLAMALRASNLRIVAPLPGKSTLGIEVPNERQDTVTMRELLDGAPTDKLTLPLMLGKTTEGVALTADLAQMPHLLIAGATGSGKSVCISTLLMSLLMTRSPAQVRLVLIDPKMVELGLFADVPHLLSPVVTDMSRAPAVLEWAVRTMEERYQQLAACGVRNLASYNQQAAEPLPAIVIVIDELADLMMVASREVEASITRLAQKSRAVGIHVILATQRPSVDVITGLIKANMPTRIAFQVTSTVDSRTILDRKGAERLMGKGDLLYLPPRSATLVRAQGAYVSEEEIARMVAFWKESGLVPRYVPELLRAPLSDDDDVD